MPASDKVSCAKCQWRRSLGWYYCVHPEFSTPDHISGHADYPNCARQNIHGNCKLFQQSGKLRLFFRRWWAEMLVSAFLLAVVGGTAVMLS